ncbi:MAG: polyribonucleotide nucleotidyltransferase [Planctomycetota bacterium]
MLSTHSVEREIGGRTLRIETGKVAKLATSCVFVTYGETTVMCSCVRSKPRPGLDFFPMQVDYREKLPAAGKFPGGFRKREGAPNEKEVLTMRMIDRPIRPLFPDGFIDEVQIQCWVMSHDQQNDADVLASVGAAAALALSNAPFEGPLGTVRVGRIHTEEGYTLVVNPTVAQLEYSDLDLVLSGHRDGINMIEVGAAEIPDDEMLEAIEFGFDEITPILDMIDELAEQCGQEVDEWDSSLPDADVAAEVKKLVEKELTKARQIKGKHDRGDRVSEIKREMLDEHFVVKSDGTYEEYQTSDRRRRHASEAFRQLEKKITRKLIVDKGLRADGRDLEEIRPLDMHVGVFSRPHGSALFERGETQSLVSCTLGTGRDEQIVDGLTPEYAKKFYLHYNFPPFCVGEAGRIMGPGRREVGHGALAERSLMGVIPDPEDFPYTIRLVSDITESNGSSSMASICGGCLALMDAGVPITNTCAGITVGRFTDEKGKKVTHVMDIIGEEDFFGDMDFKIAGTRDGITGIQLDLKARGLDMKEITKAFKMAHTGRVELIDAMEGVIEGPREDVSPYAPRIHTLMIHPDKIGKLIGPGGKTIRAISERHGVKIDVEDDGSVTIASADGPALDGAVAEVEAMVAEIKVGTVFEGKVVSLKDFGAFIELAPGTDGMCHISEIAEGFVKDINSVVKVGDTLRVKVINVDDQGRIKLSRKALLRDEAPAEEETVEA